MTKTTKAIKNSSSQRFSEQLGGWVSSKQPKTLDTLIANFGEKSFAVIILLFMLLPALPIPTGGITHVFEAVVVVIAAEQVIGLKAIWLPDFLSRRIKLERLVKGKTMEAMLKRITWLESKSSPRGKLVFKAPLFSRIIGLIIIALTVAAFLAPPFSGLDTLPALGIVLICLSLLLEDAVLLAVGLVIGAAGALISIFLGAAAVHFFKGLFH
ncbi:MAG: exopolysaccharide biosynthesis protein [Patescibacteria group bacterium]|nr:exopolysaccharide biosynthesis protein [Patescibacteria group bacterium]